jgi:hypothetical protein
MKFWLAVLLCFSLISVVESQTPVLEQPANCKVQGQIVQPGGLPIRKADIRLYGVGEYQEQEDALYTAVTDGEGRFKIEDVKPDRYRLFFQHAGFVDFEKRRHGSGMLLSLEPGQEVKDLLFHMAPGAVITGKVTDADGDPIPSVDVVAVPYPKTLQGPRGFGDRTNEVGEYRISSVPSNRYLLMAQPVSQLRRAVESAKTGEKNARFTE